MNAALFLFLGFLSKAFKSNTCKINLGHNFLCNSYIYQICLECDHFVIFVDAVSNN